jgi:hypothetical protein
MKKYQYDAVGIKSKEGMRIYDNAMHRASNLQKQVEKAITEKEIALLDKKRLKVISDAVARAKLLNPPPRAKKKAVGKLRFR